ncbi:MAG: sialate O-acetylesterase, partial [Chthoniobacteraceae bacterium]
MMTRACPSVGPLRVIPFRHVRDACLALLVCVLADCGAHAEVKLPALFSDRMVLQAGVTAPVWGWAGPGEEVTVSLAGQSQTATTAPDGKWMVKLASMEPQTGAQTMTVRGKNTITVRDVLIGEVWLCSGQSNMAMLVSRAKDYEQEQVAAKQPQIRMFT